MWPSFLDEAVEGPRLLAERAGTGVTALSVSRAPGDGFLAVLGFANGAVSTVTWAGEGRDLRLDIKPFGSAPQVGSASPVSLLTRRARPPKKRYLSEITEEDSKKSRLSQSGRHLHVVNHNMIQVYLMVCSLFLVVCVPASTLFTLLSHAIRAGSAVTAASGLTDGGL